VSEATDIRHAANLLDRFDAGIRLASMRPRLERLTSALRRTADRMEKQETAGETVRIERHHGMDLPLYWIRHGSLGEEIEDGPYRLTKLPRKRKRP